MKDRSRMPRSTAAVICLAIVAVLVAHPTACGQSPIAALEDEIAPRDWSYLGPFSVGAREGLIGLTRSPVELAPSAGDSFPSMLAPGGWVRWKQIEPDSAGWVNITFEQIPWDTLLDIYGYAGIVNGAYAYTEFQVPTESRALVSAEKIAAFWLNGKPLLGDPYGHGYMKIPVLLRQGINRIVAKLTGFGDHTFCLRLEPPPAPVVTSDDFTVPDIVEGEAGRFWIGIPLLNTTAETIDHVTVLIGDGTTWEFSSTRTRLAPLAAKKIPCEVKMKTGPGMADRVHVPITVEACGIALRDSIELRVRAKDQSIKRTFISGIDGSCQYYAVLAPSNYDPNSRYALILTLHGAAVIATRQADSYRPKPWAFIVVPTNRRPYGFDWQDWGRLDALEVLEIAKSTLPIDTSRVYLTGHSMGGHGVWHVGLTHADRFAAMAPGAGWTRFDLYVPWFLQKAYIFGSPQARVIRDVALRQDWPLTFLENARNLPIFILQGGSDDNVPPVHARMFVKRLDELGYEHVYKEVPGKGHWWSIDSLTTSCVDDPDLMDFLRARSADHCPEHVVFRTTNVGHSDRLHWVRLIEQRVPYMESTIDARVVRDTIRIATANVEQFAISIPDRLISSEEAVLSVDGRTWTLTRPGQDEITLSGRAGQMMPGGKRHAGLRKSRYLFGPIKQAYFSPFELVYGTQGDASTTETLLHQARLEAYQWWRRANGMVEILPDTEVTPAVIESCNIVLFGGPGENLYTSRINRHLPIRIDGKRLQLGTRVIQGDGIAAKFVYPNPENPDRLVVVHEGTDSGGIEISTFFKTIYAGAGLPDFVVFDSEAERTGWGGVIAAGFFDNRWRLDRNLMYVRD